MPSRSELTTKARGVETGVGGSGRVELRKILITATNKQPGQTQVTSAYHNSDYVDKR